MSKYRRSSSSYGSTSSYQNDGLILIISMIAVFGGMGVVFSYGLDKENKDRKIRLHNALTEQRGTFTMRYRLGIYPEEQQKFIDHANHINCYLVESMRRSGKTEIYTYSYIPKTSYPAGYTILNP